MKELYLFGTAVSNEFTEVNEFDFMVKFNRQGFEGAFDQFLNFKNALEKIYERPVDLYHLKKFRNHIFQQEVERTKQLLYAV